MKQTVTVLGGGAFGTAIAQILSDNDHKVNLWCYEKEVVDCIKNDHENKKYLCGTKLNSNIYPTQDLSEAFNDGTFIFEAIPVKFLRNILNRVKSILNQEQILVVLSKGIEQDSLLLPTQIVDDVFDNKIKKAVMAGPNFAAEIVKKFMTATAIASDDQKISQDLKNILLNDYFKPKVSKDVVGLQVGGAIKNIICLAAGIVKGYTDSQNTLAYVITNGLKEIAKVVKCFGGKPDTAYGLSGFGDLVLSATSDLSKNNRAGMLIGQGKKLQDLKTEFATLPEGINTTVSIYDLIQKCNLDLPVCTGTYQVLFEEKTINQFLNDIF